MVVVIKSGAKTIGVAKSKRGVNKVLASEYRKENKVSVFKQVKKSKKRRKKR